MEAARLYRVQPNLELVIEYRTVSYMCRVNGWASYLAGKYGVSIPRYMESWLSFGVYLVRCYFLFLHSHLGILVLELVFGSMHT